MSRIVMILTNGFDPDVRVYKEAKYLAARQNKVTVLCWDRENKYKENKIAEIDGINIIRFFPYAKYASGFMNQIKAYRDFINECKKYIKQIKYDFIHGHDLDGFIASIFINRNKVPLILDMHEYYVNSKNRLKRLLQKKLVEICQNKADHIIYLNDLQKSDIRMKNNNKLIFLPNYSEQFKYTTKTYSTKIRISYIGYLRCYDSLKSLIEICKKYQEIELFIHGGGHEYGRLLEEYGTVERCHITGLYKPEQREDLYSNTDVLYAVYDNNTNLNNAFTVKFFEGLLTETPIIARKHTLMGSFVVEHDIGFAIADNVELECLILELIKNQELIHQKSHNIRNLNYKEEYSWEHIVKNLDLIYQKGN